MKKKRKTPSFITIGILTLITVFFWIFFSIFRAFTVKPAIQVPEELLTPVNPTLDTNALNSIEEKFYLEDSQIPDIEYGPATAPSPTPSAGAEIILETTPTPSPQASPSGSLEESSL
jgi:hypothetical protein